MHRRQFLSRALGAAAAGTLCPRIGRAQTQASPDTKQGAPFFKTGNRAWQAAYEKALEILAGNVQVMPRFDGPVLIEGAEYAGMWQECGPHEALVYRHFRPDVARNAHMTFFALQRPNGQLPANNKRSEMGFGQIQMVVPIAATAWELVQASRDDELLAKAYTACARWDEWLRAHRNTRGTGLVEGFCTYDTGMDHSPRWAGMPNQCPGKDAAVCPPAAGLPRLCPDLSATVYGGRVALAAMASALGKSTEAADWQERAHTLRERILETLYVEEDAAFYDRDANGAFIRVRCDILTRMCSERVVDAPIFARLWARQLGNSAAFWTPYPLPSVAADDPRFVRPIPRNSWGGASQALTALRAGRWMDAYGRSAEFAHMMSQWCAALIRDGSFRQQIDPQTGAFSEGDLPGYSPACLVLYDYTWRLAGIHDAGSELYWSAAPGCPATEAAVFRLALRRGTAEMRYHGHGVELSMAGTRIASVQGTGRLVTSPEGSLLRLVGTAGGTSVVELRVTGRPPRRISLEPNQVVLLSGHG